MNVLIGTLYFSKLCNPKTLYFGSQHDEIKQHGDN